MKIYGFVVTQPFIQCDMDTDYQDVAMANVKKVYLFLDEKERDESAEEVRRNSHYEVETEKFTTKSNQGRLRIIPYKKYDEMTQRIKQLEEELSKYKNNV